MDSLDQMSDLCCPICLLSYSEKDNVPHTLLCGHTHCSKCLENLLIHPGSKCGECRMPINVRFVRSLPINYSVLRILETLKSSDKHINEFREVEKKVESVMKKLNDTKNVYYMKLDDMKRKIAEIDKENKTLAEAKQTLNKKFKNLRSTKTLNESLESIQDTIACIENLDRQNQIIMGRLAREEDVGRFQSLFDSPEDYYITSEKTKGQTSLFVRNGVMYVRSFPQHFNRPRKFEIKINTFRPYIVRTFIIISYNNVSSMIEFELFDKEVIRAKQFLEMCLGEKRNYRGAQVYDHDRLGMEGESISFGHNDEEKSSNNVDKGCRKVDYIKKGYLTATSSVKKVNHVKVYLEGWPCRSSPHCFGRVVTGLNVLKSVLRNKFEVKITECGVVLDFSGGV